MTPRLRSLVLALALSVGACTTPEATAPYRALEASVRVSETVIYGDAVYQLFCRVADDFGEQVSFSWRVAAGLVFGSGGSVDWETPVQAGNYEVSCTASASGVASGTASIEVRVLDAALGGRWVGLAPVPSDHQETGNALLDGKIYVVGGLDAGGQVQSRVDVYDPVVDEWSSSTPLPYPRHHASVAAAETALFVFGGISNDYDDPIVVQSEVFKYDLGDNAWTQVASMPRPRYASAAVTVGGRIHVFGGADSNMSARNFHDVYDPVADTWLVMPPMPTRREHLSAAAIDSVIYVVGGRAAEHNTRTTTQVNVLEGYDLSAGSWTTLEPMPSTRAGFAVASFDGRLFAFGGEVFHIFPTEGGTDRVVNAVEAYDPTTDRWSILAPMPTPRHGMTASVYGDFILVLAGGWAAGLSPSRANEMFIPPPSSTGARWTP